MSDRGSVSRLFFLRGCFPCLRQHPAWFAVSSLAQVQQDAALAQVLEKQTQMMMTMKTGNHSR